jgi:DNA invertase Pin-like site-specific DNA recombinase
VTHLTEVGCAKIFTEQMSGAVTGRPALDDALDFARSGDTFIVWKLERLARSMKQLITVPPLGDLLSFSSWDFWQHKA